MGRGVDESIRALAGDLRAWVAIGQVTAVESHAQWGFIATITLQPSGGECQARIMSFGAGAGAGIHWPVAVDDEVLVLFPAGDPNRAICMPGLPSSEAAPSDDWTNDLILVEGVDRPIQISTGTGGNRMVLTMDPGSGTVTIEAAAIKLGENATDKVAVDSKVRAELDEIRTAFDSHVHPAPTGTTMTPATPFATPSGDVGCDIVTAE